MSALRIDWATVLARAVEIVESYSTPVGLRQTHYRLCSPPVGGYENTIGCYKQLSSRTAALRRAGEFPSLADHGRAVSRPYADQSPAKALRIAAATFRLDRTAGQQHQVWLLFEKATLQAQFESWTRPYGLPIAALRGYSSESLERDVFGQIDRDGRPVVVFYVGDLDPEGEDIERNFRDQATSAGISFEHWERLAVTPPQIAALGLVPNPGKEASSRAAGFIQRHGELFQIETEAVDPAELNRLVVGALADEAFFDRDAYDATIAAENEHRERLKQVAAEFEDAA